MQRKTMAKQASTSRVARARLRQMDDALQAVQLPTQPAQGWVRTIRAALGMTQKQRAPTVYDAARRE